MTPPTYGAHRSFRRDRGAGFTLLELLMALTILSFIIAAIYGAFGAGIAAQRKCRNINERISSARNAMTVMSIEMRNAVYFCDMYMEGSSQRISFLTPSPVVEMPGGGDENSFNLNRIDYFFEPTAGDSGDLKKSVQKWPNKAPAGPPEKMEGGAVLANVRGFKISYCRQKKKGIQGDTYVVQTDGVSKEEEHEWTDTWESRDGFPLGVRIEMTVPENTGDDKSGKGPGQELKIVKILYPEYALNASPPVMLSPPPVLLEKEDAGKDAAANGKPVENIQEGPK